MKKSSTRSPVQELKESEIFYRHLAELSPDAIVIFSGGIIVYVNPTGVRLIGAKHPAELIGKPIMQFIHPSSQETVKKRIQIMMEKKKPVPVAVENIIGFNNKLLITEVKSAPFMFRGQPAILTVLRDITERTCREEQEDFLNKASEVLMSTLDFQTTMKNIAHLIVPFISDYCRIAIIDDKGNIQQITAHHANHKKVSLVESLFDEYKGKPGVTHGIEKILETGKPEIITKVSPEILDVAGSKKLTETALKLGVKSYMGIPLLARGKIIGAITFSSSTEGKYYSKKDLAFVQELGRRIAFSVDNARHLTNEQKAVRLRDDFLSVASHELKTPVTSLKAYVQVLRTRFQRAGDRISAEHLGKMDTQINKLTALIQDLLDATKIQSGKLQMHESKFSFGELVIEIVEEIQRTTAHAIQLKGTTNKMVHGNPERIGQVLSNLLTNAIKYSPEPQPIIVNTEEKPSEVVCSVQDFGIGISEYQIPFIFEQFYRELSDRENTFPGLGLGLYISAEIIKRHGGNIWVESKKGKGSTFYFSLPLR